MLLYAGNNICLCDAQAGEYLACACFYFIGKCWPGSWSGLVRFVLLYLPDYI